MNYYGILIGAVSFLCIGIFHPIVIKAEYHFGCKCWPVFLIIGLILLTASVLIDNYLLSCLLAVIGFSCLWSILELFHQRRRVQKGWFPSNPNRKE